MKKIEKRAVLCLLLAGALLAGTALFVFRFVVHGGSWASWLPVFSGQPAAGRVLDRDGDVLTWVEEDGTRRYYDGATVRKATLHAVGDAEGRIGTGALVAFADKLSGYNLLTGAYSPLGRGNDLYLTIDARYNYIAYNALGGRKGAVGVYNYKTGEVLCMVSSPTFDPLYPPEDAEDNPAYEGVYLNRLLSGTFPPGSVYKTVVLSAAIENLPGLFDRTWTCTGSVTVGEGPVTCPHAHGEQDIYAALSNSCNGVFAQLAAELGEDTLARYTEQAGLTASYSVNGLNTAAGSFDLDGLTANELGWAGVGQYNDLVNPCALMVYMGAVANGGRAAVPRLVLKTENALGLPSLPAFTQALKTKNYTYTRAARSLLHLLLGITCEDMKMARQLPLPVPYCRILGFRKEAAPLLSQLRKASRIPLLTKTADARQALNAFYPPREAALAQRMLELDISAANLYEAVVTGKFHTVPKNEYTRGVLRV